MNFNEIGLKDLVLDFDSNDLQDITIVQGDTKTRGFKVLVSTNNGEIIKASSNYEMRLYGVNSNYPDKSFFTKGTIDGDFYKVYISTDMASKSGKLQLQLALFEGTNALIQSRIKEVDVYSSIANGGNVGKDLVVDFGKLENALNRADEQSRRFEQSLVRQQAVESQIAEKHTEVVQIRDGLKDVLTTENARVEAEKKRVSAEDVRASNESTRQSNESTRQSNENARQQNESTRTSNESQRQAEESTRKSEEQKRISAETNRNSEEIKRDNAEKIRIENENKRTNAENTRAENDTTYNKNEQQRQQNESTRQTQEQQRVDAEKLRASQESTRKQSEDTRNSQENTRQTQEQSRVDAESKRAESETAREQSEQTRDTKESERQNAEKIRQSNEQTRVSQENSRVEAEKQRAAAEADRAGKFAGWDKTMQGVIPTATSTVAGIVRIDVDGESTAVSKKSFDNNIENLKSDVEKNKSEITAIDNNAKENKKHLDFLYSTLAASGDENAIEDSIENNIIKFLNTCDLSEDNHRIINNLEDTVKNEKADKKHTHTIADITDLQTALDSKLEQKDISTLKTQVDKNTKDISGFEERYNQLNTAFDGELKLKADKTHTHKIADVEGLQTELNSKASEEDLNSWTNYISKLGHKQNEIEDNIRHNFESIGNLEMGLSTKAKKSDVAKLEEKVNKIEISKLQNDILVGYLTSKDVDIQKIAFTNKGIGKAIYRYLELTNQVGNVDKSALESCESLIEILKNVELLEKLPSTILTSETAMNFIVNNSEAMKIISDNSLVMNNIANSNTAMNILVNSRKAMNIIIFSDTAMSLIINSNTAMNSFVNSKMAMSYILSVKAISDKIAKKALYNAEFATNFYKQVKENSIYKLISSKDSNDDGLRDKFNNMPLRQFVIANLGKYSDTSDCKHKLTLSNGNTLETEFKGKGNLSKGANFIMFNGQKHYYDGDDYDGYALYELVE